MKFIADFHIHSPYARAVSKDMTLENLDQWGKKKGITVLGTGDFTHPQWMREIRGKLEPAEKGLYRLKENSKGTHFILTVEISSIYSKGGKTRRVHTLVFVPSIATAEKINAELSLRGNIKSDGRPILGLDPKILAKIVFDIDPAAVIIPAHAWTPWFSIFGSMSGFDSIDECFEEYTKEIFAIETGLSSDPAMNWRWSHLDRITLISNSDSHSLQRIGREANVFDTELSYPDIMDAIRANDPKRFLFTIEFFPEEGKYHYDGHRACNVRFSPDETKAHNGRCPKCGKPVTVGVMNRVETLADRPLGGKPAKIIPFKSLVPLDEVIAESFGVGVASKRVKEVYEHVVAAMEGEFSALVEASRSDLAAAAPPEVVEAIMRVREGRLHIEPGYDGEYGEVKIFEGEEKRIFSSPQTSLF